MISDRNKNCVECFKNYLGIILIAHLRLPCELYVYLENMSIILVMSEQRDSFEW